MKIFRSLLLIGCAVLITQMGSACRKTYEESMLQTMQSQGAHVVACNGKSLAPLPGKIYSLKFPQQGYAEYQPLCRKVMTDTLALEGYQCVDGTQQGPPIQLVCTFDVKSTETAMNLVPVELSVKAVSWDGKTTYWNGTFVSPRPPSEVRRMIFTSITGLSVAAAKNLGKNVNAPVNVLRKYHPIMKAAYRRQLDAAEDAKAAAIAVREAETAEEAEAAKAKIAYGIPDTAAVEAAQAAKKEADKAEREKEENDN